MSDLSPVEQYAIEVVADGAESHREDDLNEDGKLDDAKHAEAIKLAGTIVKAIRANGRAILDLAQLHEGRKR
jgi:hypothetical protein